MVYFPNAKINLGLKVRARREDGFHDIQTVFYPIPLRDVLEIIQDKELKFQSTGNPIPPSAGSVSVIKAWELLKADFPQLPPVSIHLHKAIPSGAGLGGGSADGAFMLKALNQKFNLQLSEKELAKYALMLGSDCPFFIFNKPAIGEGRGEILTEIQLDLSSYAILIVNPGIHISTAEAFRFVKISNKGDLGSIITSPLEAWKENLINDFEEPIFRMHPELETIKKTLYEAGAVYASMSGSGSTMFGIFKEKKELPTFPSQFFVKWV